MNAKQYRNIRIAVALYVSLLVSISTNLENSILAIIAVVSGMIFILAAKSRVKDVMVDERLISVSEKAAKFAYGIFTPVIGLSSVFFMFMGKNGQPYLESLGIILSYLTLFILTLYSISFYYLNRKYGDGSN